MKNLSLTALILLISFCVNAQQDRNNSCLYVKLVDASFDSLSLLGYSDDKNALLIGEKIGTFQWKFIIPDTIIHNFENIILMAPSPIKSSKSITHLRFVSPKSGPESAFPNIGLEDKVNFIEGKYLGETLFERENITQYLASDKDSIVIGDIICKDFQLILKNDSSDISVRAIDPNFAWFLDSFDSVSYQKALLSYIEISKRYPDSKYLVSSLALNLKKFKTKDDLRSVYKNLSAKHWKYGYSQKISRFLGGKFENLYLANLATGLREKIIQDSTKYNLITFSASWCQPCIEEIPLLKGIYHDLKDKLNFTYISLDLEKDITSFKRLVATNEMPWRTLLAYRSLEVIRSLYFITGIPYSMLVYPNGHFDIIELRLETERKKLYKLLK